MKIQLQRMDRVDQKARMADGNDFALPRLDAVEDSVAHYGVSEAIPKSSGSFRTQKCPGSSSH